VRCHRSHSKATHSYDNSQIYILKQYSLQKWIFLPQRLQSKPRAPTHAQQYYTTGTIDTEDSTPTRTTKQMSKLTPSKMSLKLIETTQQEISPKYVQRDATDTFFFATSTAFITFKITPTAQLFFKQKFMPPFLYLLHMTIYSRSFFTTICYTCKF